MSKGSPRPRRRLVPRPGHTHTGELCVRTRGEREVWEGVSSLSLVKSLSVGYPWTRRRLTSWTLQ